MKQLRTAGWLELYYCNVRCFARNFSWTIVCAIVDRAWSSLQYIRFLKYQKLTIKNIYTTKNIKITKQLTLYLPVYDHAWIWLHLIPSGCNAMYDIQLLVYLYRVYRTGLNALYCSNLRHSSLIAWPLFIRNQRLPPILELIINNHTCSINIKSWTFNTHYLRTSVRLFLIQIRNAGIKGRTDSEYTLLLCCCWIVKTIRTWASVI